MTNLGIPISSEISLTFLREGKEWEKRVCQICKQLFQTALIKSFFIVVTKYGDRILVQRDAVGVHEEGGRVQDSDPIQFVFADDDLRRVEHHASERRA